MMAIVGQPARQLGRGSRWFGRSRGQPGATGDRLRPRINRAPSPILSRGIPLPPLAFMALLAWRMLRPGMLPVWAGAPLGAFDDLFSGQPFGSAILLWSVVMIAMEIVDVRLRWRGFLQDWALASVLIGGYLVLAMMIANLTGGAAPLEVIVPQIVLSLLVHPLVTRLVAALDRLRLLPVKRVGR